MFPLRKVPLDWLKIEGSEQIKIKHKNGTVVIKRPESGETNSSGAEMEITANNIDLNDISSQIVTGLRLSNEGAIGFSGLPDRNPPLLRRDYKICDETGTSVQGIIDNLSSIEAEFIEPTIIHLVLNRFNRSYDADNPEDLLVDLTICLEILYSKKSEKCFFCHIDQSSKSIFIQERIGYFLVKNCVVDEKSEESMKNKVGKAYDIRNDIVHGGKWFNPQTRKIYSIRNIYDFLLKIRDYTRDSLVYYIQEIKDTQKTSEEVKHNIIREAMKYTVKKLHTSLQ